MNAYNILLWLQEQETARGKAAALHSLNDTAQQLKISRS